jgi:nitrite reductase/ring-hydroxylating ferredoxin subunit
MDTSTSDFVHAGSLEELRARRRLLVHGRHRPILLVEDGGQVFALDNRCPHMGFPLASAARAVAVWLDAVLVPRG